MVEYQNYIEYKKIITTNENSSISQNEIEIVQIKPRKKGNENSEKKFLSNERKLRIRKRVREWSKSLTAHGFPKILNNQRLITKLFWSLALILSISYCILNIYKEIVKYFHYEYTTHLETIVEIPSLFPVITLCNINPLMTKAGENLVVDIFKKDYDIDLNQSHSLSPLELIERLDNANMKARLNAFLPEYGDWRRRLLGFSLEDTLIECFYNHQVCDHRDFIWSYSPDYGNCFQFNTGFDAEGKRVPIEESFKPGSQNGLQLMFFLDESNNRFSSKWNTGLKVFVHHQSSKASKFEGINVKAATSTNIALSRKFESKLPIPYTRCIDFEGFLNFF